MELDSTGRTRSGNDMVTGEKFEGRGGVGLENGAEERRQLGRVLLDQRDHIDDTSRRNVSRRLYWFGGVLVVNIETKHRQNILDNGEIRATAGVEDGVEGFETGSLEPSPCGSESGGSGGVQRNGLGIDTELARECPDLSLGRDGVKGRSTQRLGNPARPTSTTKY